MMVYEEDLTGFRHAALLEAFFAATPTERSAFDPLRYAGRLWPHLYLLEVEPDGCLRVRLAGDALRTLFKRDLSGIDLRRVTHGVQGACVLEAYEAAIAKGRRSAIRQTIDFKASGLRRTIECAMAPLHVDGIVVRIVGCFVEDTETVEPLSTPLPSGHAHTAIVVV